MKAGYVIRSKVRTNPFSYMGRKTNPIDTTHPFDTLDKAIVFDTFEEADQLRGSNSEVLTYDAALALEHV